MPPLRRTRYFYLLLVPNYRNASANSFIFQIDVAVNAPEAGIIKEFLANEEDTVVVGQDLVRLELGGAPAAGEKDNGASEPKQPSTAEPPKKDEPKPKDEPSTSPPPQEKKPEPKKDTQPPKQSEPKIDSKSASSAPVLGNREERRV